MSIDNENGDSFPFSVLLETIPLGSNVPRETLERNIVANAASGFPFLLDEKFKHQDEPLAIVGGGPSLHDTIKDLRHFKHIMVCSSAHDHVIENGIYPQYALFCDAMPNPPWFRHKRNDCTYLISTQCDPTLLNDLESCRVYLWDIFGSAPEATFQKRGQLNGGSTGALRAPALGMVLGFDDFHFFGMDSSFKEERFAYDDDTDTAESLHVSFEGKIFKTTLPLVAQAQDFEKLLTEYGHLFSVTVHGESLCASVWKDMCRKRDALFKREKAA